MKLPGFLAFAAVVITASAFGQTASLQADTTALSAAGGTVSLTASIKYDARPGAIGWAIELPGDWKLVAVSGPNVPAIAPGVGAAGTLEFAYAEVPAERAEFTLVISYPAGAAAAKAVPTVLVRTEGKLATLNPAPVEFQVK
jgi:hypothetical protein